MVNPQKKTSSAPKIRLLHNLKVEIYRLVNKPDFTGEAESKIISLQIAAPITKENIVKYLREKYPDYSLQSYWQPEKNNEF